MEQDLIQVFLDGGGVVTIENWFWHDPYLCSYGKDEKGYWEKGWDSTVDDGTSEVAYEQMEASEKSYFSDFEGCRERMFRSVPFARGTDEDMRKIIEAGIEGSEGVVEDL